MKKVIVIGHGTATIIPELSGHNITVVCPENTTPYVNRTFDTSVIETIEDIKEAPPKAKKHNHKRKSSRII